MKNQKSTGERVMKKFRLNYSITFDEITPESAKDGDFSETGFVIEDSTIDIRQLVEMIESEGYSSEIEFNLDGIRASQEFYTSCYRTATERRETLHVGAKPHQVQRIKRILDERRRKILEKARQRELKLRAV